MQESEAYAHITIQGITYRYLPSFKGQHAHVSYKSGEDWHLGTDREIRILMDHLKSPEAQKQQLGSRYNQGKIPYDLIDPEALEGLAAVLAFGATKYAAHNWRGGLHWMGIIASMLRHTFAFMRGEDLDKETNLPHTDHVFCNAMFLAWMFRNRKDLDDRWRKPSLAGDSNQAATYGQLKEGDPKKPSDVI